jgi:hypothetical protein
MQFDAYIFERADGTWNEVTYDLATTVAGEFFVPIGVASRLWWSWPPEGVPGVTDWCRRYANWSLYDVVSETEFGYELTYTHETCNREVGWVEQFEVILDQTDPPKGEVTRLSSTNPGVEGEYTLPIERCTTDINATVACTFETGLGAPTQNPAP